MRSQDSQLSLLRIGLFSLIPTQVSKDGTSIWQWRQMRIMRLIDSFDLRLFLSPLALGLARGNVHSSHLFPRLAWGHTSTCEDAEGTPPDHLTGEWKHIIQDLIANKCIQYEMLPSNMRFHLAAMPGSLSLLPGVLSISSSTKAHWYPLGAVILPWIILRNTKCR